MTKKAKTKKKKSNKKSSKSALFDDKSIVWALIFGVALAASVIWYIMYY